MVPCAGFHMSVISLICIPSRGPNASALGYGLDLVTFVLNGMWRK